MTEHVVTHPTARDRTYEYYRARRRRALAQRTYTCLWCGRVFTTSHHPVRWCSVRCREAAWRAPKTWALIIWDRHLHPSFRYFPTRAAAMAERPASAPWSVVNAAVPLRPDLSIPELIRMTSRPVIAVPYPNTRKGRPLRLAGSGRVLPPQPDANASPPQPYAEQPPS